ncbi:glycine betaine ABC transporter substrate-binding protein [Devosia chinhatensis]|uniref:ABC-type glycine betaine transport system substrate-binding domain-containing protein n=1 Tax=Devosia chinhatensis TaxID=429727 RepID=A0A0F5FFR3_9HYPH|nr:glycine betaine ABC transporter substrate-binding protein [Devosia chinhatensis]KKB07739.1 hypothetical protein VE26_13830 [Devosia chinhatensis]
MRTIFAALTGLALVLTVSPAQAQFTTLDDAQDGPQTVGQSAQPASTETPCGNQPFTIARMNWPSAMLLSEIHERILKAEFGCEVRESQADLGAALSSMASTGQPALAPELWVNRVADVWNAAIEAQMVRSAAPTYTETSFEGWFMPGYMAAGLNPAPTASALATTLAAPGPDEKIRFISCPTDWACSIINRNLIAAHGLSDRVEIIEPANRLEMDRSIGEAVNRREPFLFYYWQPNAILAQLDFVAIDMGAYDEVAARCLAGRNCADPKPSAFPPEMVVMAVADRVFLSNPVIAAYIQRATLPLAEMNRLLAELNQPGATAESVAERFVAQRRDLWGAWVTPGLPE